MHLTLLLQFSSHMSLSIDQLFQANIYTWKSLSIVLNHFLYGVIVTLFQLLLFAQDF